MKKVRLYESFHNIDEARHSEIHKAAKKGSYPITIVITNKGGKFDGKVAHQETVDTPAAVPAAMKVLYKKYATWAHTFAIEDATGKILFQEGLEVTEAKAFDKLNKMASKRFGEHGVATLSEDEMAELIDLTSADEMAEKMFGEFGFATLSEDEMEKLINKNPKLVKESNITEANQLKKGDIVKFKDGRSIHIIGPKGDGYDYKDGREKGHHPKGWFDMMISSGKAMVESVVTEANADGTISDDEDERRAALVKKVKEQMEEILASAELDANDIGGKFRAPGIIAEVRKEIERQVKKFR